jgi:HEPN domain-containing protein
MKYETISQLLRDLKTCGLSESILKDIETIETIHLRYAYRDSSVSVPFEQWYESTFKTESK